MHTVLMTDATKPLQQLANEAAQFLREWENLPQADKNPKLTVATAERLVEAREEHFTNSAGTPDLRGSSYEYRMWLGDVYFKAGITTVEHKVRTGNRLRFAIGNLLRERHSEQELAEYGLLGASLRDRGNQRRARRTELVDLFRPGQRYTGEQVAEAAALLPLALRRMTPKPVKKRDRAAVVADLEDARALIDELLQRLTPEGKQA